MVTVINYILKSTKTIFGIIVSAIIFLYYALIKKNAKLEYDNQQKVNDLNEMDIASRKIVTIQSRQTKISAAPGLSRADLDKWLQRIAEDSEG